MQNDTASRIALRTQNRLKAMLKAGEVALCMRTVFARTTEVAFMVEAAGFASTVRPIGSATASSA